MIERARKRLSKRAKKGFRGWPVATVALYSSDDTIATKLTVGIVPGEDAEATAASRSRPVETRPSDYGTSRPANRGASAARRAASARSPSRPMSATPRMSAVTRSASAT